MSNDTMTNEAPMTNVQAHVAPRALAPSPGNPGEGRGEGPSSAAKVCGAWKLGFLLVVGSWSLALHLRIRTAATRVS
jgi:hypothetical protein